MSLLGPPRPGFRFTGWHFLAAIVGFFAVVVATDTAFAILAVCTFPGEVSSSPYEDGLAYSRTLAQQQAQAKLGWRATALAEADRLAFEVRDRNGAPVPHLSVTGELQRPATEAGKITLTFRESRPGRYVATASIPRGAWDFTGTATSVSGARFIAERRMTWP
jgi:nitrogen fixation protein FixH